MTTALLAGLVAGCGSTRAVTVTVAPAATSQITEGDDSRAHPAGTPTQQLQTYLDAIDDPAILPLDSPQSVSLDGGTISVVDGRQRVSGVTATAYTSLPSGSVVKARPICEAVVRGLQALDLSQVSNVLVMARDGSPLIAYPGGPC